MSDRLSVDLEGLLDVGARLTRVKDDLDRTSQVLGGQSHVLGDARVSGALEGFEEHWRDGRRKVVANAEALTTMVSEAVRTFRKVDDQLRDSLVAATPPPGRRNTAQL